MTWFILASSSAILSAAAAIIQKKVLFKLNALEFSFLVSIIIFAFSWFIPFSIDMTLIPSTTLLIILGKSILSGFAFLLVMMSLEHNQISIALPLLGITPAVTALLEIPILGASFQSWEWIGIGLIVAGTFLLEKRPSQKIFHTFKETFFSKNHYYIFGAVGLFAVSSIAEKMLLSGLKTDPLAILFYQHLVYCMLFGTLISIRASSIRKVLKEGKTQIIFIVSASLLTIAYRFTQLEATILAPVALVLAVKRTSILYASFFGGKLFSEERLALKLLGAALIVAAGFIILRNVG